MTAKRKQENAVTPIRDRLLTLREAAEVLRLSTPTVREYVERGEIEGGASSADGGDSGVQTLTLYLRMHHVTGTSLEKKATEIRWWTV